MKNYELVNALEFLGDNNNGLIYGINWLDDNGYIVDCEWFRTEKERLLAVSDEKTMNTNTPKHTAGNHELNCDCHYCQHLKHCSLVHEELLEALKSCYRALSLDSDMEEDFKPEIEIALHAIAKAEGRN